MHLRRFLSLGLVCLGLVAVAPADVHAGNVSFSQFIQNLWPEAKRLGVSRATFDRAFRNVTPDPGIVTSESSQPEFVRPIWDYIDRAVSQRRIREGKAQIRRHNARLREIGNQFDVSHYYLVAIWGMETSYGKNRGKRSVIRSLATLAYKGRRKEFGREQLLAAAGSDAAHRVDTQPAEKRLVPAHEGDLASAAGARHDHVGLALVEHPLGRHQLDRYGHSDSCRVRAFSRTDSAPPTLKNACSGTSSSSPPTRASNDSTVSSTGQ